MPSPPAPADPPDTLFAVVAGLDLGLFAGTVAVGFARRIVTGPATLYVLLLSVVSAVTVVGALLVRRIRGLDVRLGRDRLGWLVPAAPILVAVAVLGLGGAGLMHLEIGDVVVATFGGAATVLVGLGLRSMAVSRWAAAMLADASVHATWEAAWPRREKRQLEAGGLAVLVLGMVLFTAGTVLGYSPARVGGHFVLIGALVAVWVGQQRTYRATDRGLEVVLPVARRLHPWDSFATYRLTDGGVVLHRTSPLSVGFRFDRESLEDEDAVLAVLDRYVERN